MPLGLVACRDTPRLAMGIEKGKIRNSQVLEVCGDPVQGSIDYRVVATIRLANLVRCSHVRVGNMVP